ncbi:hypothetical protein GYB22_00255 [bacterium]|nr:hypothetical protein [bacterium]
MSFLSKIKYNIALKKLRAHAQKEKAERFKGLSQARSVGIVYNVGKIKWKTVTQFIHYFESLGKKVTTLGYLDEKELNHNYTPNFRHMFFCQRELSFWKIPKAQSLQTFTEVDFDYLINLDVEGDLVLQAVSAYSKAHTRIGLHLEDYEFCQDFMIKADVNDGPDLFEKLKDYIK